MLVDRIDALKQAFRQARSFAMPGFVVLPEHLHCLWRMPAGNDDFPMRWHLIKSRFSRSLSVRERRSHSRTHKNEQGIWQRRYWEHLVCDEADFQRCLDYTHYNPVKHGHAARAMDWLHSSFQHWVSEGYPLDWATSVDIGPNQSE